MNINFANFADDYGKQLAAAVATLPIDKIEELAEELLICWRERRQVFLIGNGGSAGNAIHLANDFLYGISKNLGHALRVHALPANSSILTCLANDEGYDGIFFRQLAVLANQGDVVVALSGSGNSANIVKALDWCLSNNVKSFAILGFDGGKAKSLAHTSIHVEVNDMQISEDIQLIVGHILMKWLYLNNSYNPVIYK